MLRGSKFKKLEKYGPVIFASLSALLVLIVAIKMCYCAGGIFKMQGTFDRVLDSVIVFTSIIVGFLGVLMGILFSMSDKELIKKFLESSAKMDLKKYFSENIFGGLLLVVLSIILYLDAMLNGYVLCVLLSIWTFLLALVFTGTYRLINIMMHVLFSANNKSENDEPQGIHMDNEKVRRLEEKFTKGKDDNF